MVKIGQIKLPPVLKKSMSIMLIRIIGMLIVYCSVLYISNVYGAETYGRFALAQTFVQFLILFFSLGIRSSIVKLTSDINFFSNGIALNNYLKKIIYSLLISSLICSIIIFLFKEWFALTVFKDETLVDYFNYMAVFIVFAIFHTVFSEYIRARKKFWQYGVYMYVLPPFFFIGLLLISEELVLPESSIILSYMLSFLFIFIILLFHIPFKHLKVKTNYSYRELFTISFPMMFSALFLFISNWTDIFMLGALATKKEVGIYSAAFKLAIVGLIVINAVNTIFAPRISELYSKNMAERLKKEFHKTRKIIILTTAPIIAILIIFSKQLLSLFGQEFIYGQSVLIIISSGLLVNVISGSVDQFLNMTKHQKQLGLFTIISASLNIFLNYVLIRRMGINGAAIASLVSNIILNLLCIVYIKRKFGFYTFKS